MNIFKTLKSLFTPPHLLFDNFVSVSKISRKNFCLSISDGSQNKVTLSNLTKRKPKVSISIVGSSNTVIIKNITSDTTGKINISIFGDNCSVEIGDDISVGGSLNIFIGNKFAKFGKVKNVNCKIGSNNRIEDVKISTANSNNNIVIGDNCLFSQDVRIFNTDAHPIYDKSSGALINYVKDLIVGNNCWFGYGASVLKNLNIPDGTIVGWKAVVAKSFDIPNCALAGNPARIVKENVSWKVDDDGTYFKNELPERKEVIL